MCPAAFGYGGFPSPPAHQALAEWLLRFPEKTNEQMLDSGYNVQIHPGMGKMGCSGCMLAASIHGSPHCVDALPE